MHSDKENDCLGLPLTHEISKRSPINAELQLGVPVDVPQFVPAAGPEGFN